MLELFVSPAWPKDYQSDLVTLKDFIHWVNASSLPVRTQQDAVKILETMRWIKVNQAPLCEFINNKNQYLSQLPERDKASGVVRDHLGTSLHFNAYLWTNLLRLSINPTTSSSEDLKKLIEGKPAYVLFNNRFYFINHNAELLTLAVESKNIAQLKSVFPKRKDSPQEGSKLASELITKLTGHSLPTPGQAAIHDLMGIINTFENTFRKLLMENQTLSLLSFVAKCEYDKDRGCLEARVELAMDFAGNLESTHGLCALEAFLQICQLLHFFDLGVGQSDVYNYLVAVDFFAPFYGQMVLYQDQKQALTQELLFSAMEECLSYERPSEEELQAEASLKTTDIQQWQAKWQTQERINQIKTFQHLIKHAEIVQGHQGMIQYWFKEEALADQLSQWLRNCKCLALYGIEKCKTKKEERGQGVEYVVRLIDLFRNYIIPAPCYKLQQLN